MRKFNFANSSFRKQVLKGAKDLGVSGGGTQVPHQGSYIGQVGIVASSYIAVTYE